MNSGNVKTPSSSKKVEKSPSASAEKSSSAKKLIQSRLNFKTDHKNLSANDNVREKLTYTSDDNITVVSLNTNSNKRAEEEGKNIFGAPDIPKLFSTQVTGSKKRRKTSNDRHLVDESEKSEPIILESSDSQEAVSNDMNPQKKVRLTDDKTLAFDNDRSNKEKQTKLLNDGNTEEEICRNDEKLLITTGSGSSGSDAEMDITSTEDDMRLKLANSNQIEIKPTNSNSPTTKQKKVMEIRRKARDVKELELQEKRRSKQQEKEAKELAKKLEREQKSMLRRHEQEEREQKRLSELAERNEAKKKRNEAREAEIQKKNMERIRKEQEKEEAELKKKRAAEAFSKFFVTKSINFEKEHQQQEDSVKNTLAFQPFQIRCDMRLAPISRVQFSEINHNRLDQYLFQSNDLDHNLDTLYLDELRSGEIVPRKSLRIISETESEADDEVIIVDELNAICQAITEEHNRNKENRFRAKFYKFHDNRRPPYYGTWRKRSAQIGPRRPFARDEKYFNYDVDSDEEWEEDEPGEALDDSEGDKDNESEEDDYEVDNEWFVPHGHLSEEELQNADDECNDLYGNDTPEAQKSKLQFLQLEFAQEMKKKTEKIKPRLVGCIWVDCQGDKPAECPSLIWDNLCNKAMLSCDTTLKIEDIDNEEAENILLSQNNINGINTISVKDSLISFSEDILQNLIRLVHGNHHSKEFLVKEFLAFLKKTNKLTEALAESQRKKIESQIREKITELASWQRVHICQERQLSPRNLNKSAKKKKMCCWIVNEDILKTHGNSEIKLNNVWEYILQPKPNMLLNDSKDIKLELCNSKNDEFIKTMGPTTNTISDEKGASDKKRNICKDHMSTIASPIRKSLISQFIQKTKLDKGNSNQKSSSTDQADAETVDMITQSDIILLD